MQQLSLGRVSALQTASIERGVFTILAVEHRDAMSVIQTIEEAYAHLWFERYGTIDVDEHCYRDYQT